MKKVKKLGKPEKNMARTLAIRASGKKELRRKASNRRQSPKGFNPKEGGFVKWDGPEGQEVRKVLFVRDGFAFFSAIYSMPIEELRPATAGEAVQNPQHRARLVEG